MSSTLTRRRSKAGRALASFDARVSCLGYAVTIARAETRAAPLAVKGEFAPLGAAPLPRFTRSLPQGKACCGPPQFELQEPMDAATVGAWFRG